MEDEVIYKIKPKFNFIYEIFMPTGKKIRNTLIAFIFSVLGFIVLNVVFSNEELRKTFGETKDFSLVNNIKGIFIFFIVIILLKFAIHIVMKSITYSSISYTFYREYLEYRDSFLNQHVKTVQYSNIKEIEVIRTVFDRIMGFGIIVIHTNAENEYSNGLILYGIKNPQELYLVIDGIIHKKASAENLLKKPEQEEEHAE